MRLRKAQLLNKKYFVGDGYGLIASNKRWMCASSHHLLERENMAENKCKKLCDTNGACNFISSTNDLKCRLFSSCIERTDTTEQGSIFKRLTGNQNFE